MTKVVRALALGVALVGGVARGDDAPPRPDVPAPADALRDAREAYVLGDFARAREGFLALVQRARNLGDVPAALEAEAWVFLGEMQLFAGDRRAAEASFRMALLADAELRLSPVEHPETVIGVVEVVRQAVRAEAEAPTVRRPLPWWGYAPFGAPQFASRKPVRGSVYLALQVGAAASSVAAWVVIDRRLAAIPSDLSSDLADEAEAERRYAILLRDAWSIPSAAAFYVVWAASVVDAGVAWGKAPGVPSSAAVLPRPDGAEVVVGWSF